MVKSFKKSKIHKFTDSQIPSILYSTSSLFKSNPTSQTFDPIVRLLKGHSITTWTKLFLILTTYPPLVDNCGHFTWCLPFVMWTSMDFRLPSSPLFVHVVSEWSLANVRFCMYKYYYQVFILNLAVFHNEEFVVTNYSTYNYFYQDLK